MKVIVDRFEGNYAVVEINPNKFVNMPKELIPNAKEGDIININIDYDETNKRREHIKGLVDSLFED